VTTSGEREKERDKMPGKSRQRLFSGDEIAQPIPRERALFLSLSLPPSILQGRRGGRTELGRHGGDEKDEENEEDGKEERKKRMTEKRDRKRGREEEQEEVQKEEGSSAARRFTREARVCTMCAPAPPPSTLPLPTWCNTPREQHRTQRMNGRQQAPLRCVRTYAGYIANVDTYVTCAVRSALSAGGGSLTAV